MQEEVCGKSIVSYEVIGASLKYQKLFAIERHFLEEKRTACHTASTKGPCVTEVPLESQKGVFVCFASLMAQTE